jgi:hypothetical protein
VQLLLHDWPASPSPRMRWMSRSPSRPTIVRAWTAATGWYVICMMRFCRRICSSASTLSMTTARQPPPGCSTQRSTRSSRRTGGGFRRPRLYPFPSCSARLGSAPGPTVRRRPGRSLTADLLVHLGRDDRAASAPSARSPRRPAGMTSCSGLRCYISFVAASRNSSNSRSNNGTGLLTTASTASGTTKTSCGAHRQNVHPLLVVMATSKRAAMMPGRLPKIRRSIVAPTQTGPRASSTNAATTVSGAVTAQAIALANAARGGAAFW